MQTKSLSSRESQRANTTCMKIYNTVDVIVRLKIFTEDFTVRLSTVLNELDYTFATQTPGAALEDAEIISCEIIAREHLALGQRTVHTEAEGQCTGQMGKS